MKGIIVLDKPDACVDCEFCREIDEGLEACCILTMDEDDQELYRMIDDYCQSVPEWCPIKPIPNKKAVCGLDGVSSYKEWNLNGQGRGWNACIDQILKGE